LNSKVVYVLPAEAKSNQYYKNLLRIIDASGYGVAPFDDFIKVKSALKKKEQIFLLSWQEDSVAKSNVMFATRQFIYLVWVLTRIFYFKGKLVWIKHNYTPHKLATATFAAKYYYKMIRGLLQHFSVLKLAHSRAFCAQHSDFKFLPHPHYIVTSQVVKRDVDFFLFGKIMRYKNIPKLLSAWPSDVKLDISGLAEDQQLANEIDNEITERTLNVSFKNSFVDDIELNNKLTRTKFVICPNIEDSMIVSGVIIHALSAGCAVLARKSAFAKELYEQGFPVWQFTDEAEIPAMAKQISNELLSKNTVSYLEKYSDMQVQTSLRELFKSL
jgi:glycosyltransferase involved in cell wall biosynthesis